MNVSCRGLRAGKLPALLFGYESACRDDMEKYMSGKSDREKEYICRVLDAVVSNLGVLLNGE